MNQPQELDQERVEAVTAKVLAAIKENLQRGPQSRERALEVLNALAGSAAVVILGCDGPHGEAEEFFQKALRQNLDDLIGELPEPPK
jgi:hypothetical protein